MFYNCVPKSLRRSLRRNRLYTVHVCLQRQTLFTKGKVRSFTKVTVISKIHPSLIPQDTHRMYLDRHFTFMLFSPKTEYQPSHERVSHTKEVQCTY